MTLRRLMIALSIAALPALSFAAAKTYQVTGPVIELSDTMIVVQKGQDRRELARDSATKIKGERPSPQHRATPERCRLSWQKTEDSSSPLFRSQLLSPIRVLARRIALLESLFAR
jgi:hypothetical protein